MITVLKSNNFFVMIVYQNKRNNCGGQPGNVLCDPKADVWTQINTENNYKLYFIDSLDAKFLDDEITDILFKMFGENSIEAIHQKFGWKDHNTNPWKKSKKS